MKSKVEQYAKGDFYVEYPDVKVAKSYLQLKIEAGSVYEGRIPVVSENDIPVKMMVYDDSYLLNIKEHSLVGKKCEICFTFDATKRKRGSNYSGILHLIGNGMEKEIAYNIEIVAPFIDVNGVALEDLMKFSALAESNWEDALQIFYSEEFSKTLLLGRDDYIQVYRSLKKSLDRNQALEEFLVYIHKKKALNIQVEHNRFEFRYPKMREKHELILHRNTWGYGKVQVRSDAKFITVHQDSVCSLDFEEDFYTLEYSIDPELLDENQAHAGHILIENTLQTIRVDILIKKPEEPSRVLNHKDHSRRLNKLEIAAVLHDYLDYRIGLLTLPLYIDKTREALNKLIQYGTNVGLCKLGLLHMNILAGKEDIAREEMRRMEADFDGAISGKKEHCYYLYLKALLSKSNRGIVAACEEIEHTFDQEDDKLFYFWLMIHLDEHYQKEPQWLYSQIEALYISGYNSPVLAVELCDLINEEPLLLKKLSEAELSAVRFGLRNHYLTKEAIEEFLQLASREREFKPQVFMALKTIYETTKNPDIIRVICGMLIRGNKTEHSYYPYYLEGIRCGHKIVGIQENYLKSMDHTCYDLIPNTVLRYFNYKSALTDQEYAYLYANVVTNKRQYLDQYEEYLPNMVAFMQRQIAKGAMSDDLCVLYSEFLRPQSVTSEFAANLVNVIFKRKLTVVNKDIVAVIVSHKELEQDIVVPVVNQVAYVDLITESAVVSLVDKNKNRYVSTIPYKLQKLVEESDYMDILSQYASDDLKYVLYQYNVLGAYEATTAREVNIARDLLNFSDISEESKQQAIYGIVRYYYQNRDHDVLCNYLNRVNMNYVSQSNAIEYINYLLECGFYELAFEAIVRFGYQGVEPRNLVKLVENLKSLSAYEREESLVAIAAHLYRMGQDTPEILSFLVDHYQSGVSDMLRLWKRSNGLLTRLELFEENILCLTLYTEKWNEDVFAVFEDYVSAKRRGMVIKAFCKRACFAYLTEDVNLPKSFFGVLYQQMTVEGLKDDMLRAAMLQFYSRQARLEEDEVKWVKEQMEYFVKRGVLLPFFRNFQKYTKLPKDLFLMTYVVTKDKAGKQIVFHYGIQSGAEKIACTKQARMIEVLPGYYMKEFVLFHGENLLYEMPEENVSKTQIYESRGMKAKGETEAYENRFEMLNSMLLNQEIGENQMLVDKIAEYLRLAAVVEENLTIME